MQIELTEAEQELLTGVLERALRETRVEVRRTSTPDFHDELQVEEKTLAELLDRVRDPTPISWAFPRQAPAATYCSRRRSGRSTPVCRAKGAELRAETRYHGDGRPAVLRVPGAGDPDRGWALHSQPEKESKR